MVCDPDKWYTIIQRNDECEWIVEWDRRNDAVKYLNECDQCDLDGVPSPEVPPFMLKMYGDWKFRQWEVVE